MKYTQVPVGFRMELFASEPNVINPIYMTWDERGRLWVVESVDYPNEFKDGRKGNDRIITALINCFEEQDTGVRLAAVQALPQVAEKGDEHTITALIARLQD